MASAVARSAPISRTANGRYRVGEVLSAGGMGTVYHGFDRLAERPVAYKRLKLGDRNSSQLTARFRYEYDKLARLRHPNIVEAYDFGFDEFGPYYTMELLPGEDLARHGRMPVREACRVLRDVASALALLHARCLIHRDVTPRNVRLTADGQAKLIDFGALIPFGRPSEIVGTAQFVAPECLDGVALDQRTDLYALGALAYWSLTGQAHVRASRLAELPEAWREPLSPPSRVTPDVPKSLDALVLSLLARARDNRPATAADVIERLTSLADLPPEQDGRRVAYSYLEHAPLCGRELATAQFTRFLGAAASGAGRIVLLEAEQGLGRSALLDDVAIEAQLEGCTVLRAQGSLHTTSFSAARHLVDTGLCTIPDASRGRSQRSSLTQLVDREGDERTAAYSATDASERAARVASRLAGALVDLATFSPLVLLIDDADAVDSESISVMASLVDSIHAGRILLVLSARALAPWQRTPAYAKLASQAERVSLDALSEQQLGKLVNTMFGGVPNSSRLSAWLRERTAGNPAQCADLARLLIAQGSIRYTVGTFTLPYEFDVARVGDHQSVALAARLSGLSPPANDIAHWLALHPGALTTADLAGVSHLSTREVLLAVEELVRRGVAISSGETFSCAGNATREALSRSRPETWTRTARLALARTLSDRDEHVLENRLAVAGHLLSAGGPEAVEGACLLARTGDEHQFDLAMTKTATPLLEKALEVLKAHDFPDEECVGLLVPLCYAAVFGEVEALFRHFDRTMYVLSSICGFSLAKRLSRVLGAKLGIACGVFIGLVKHLLARRSVNRRSFVQHVVAFNALPATACSAYAALWEPQESYRVAGWLDVFPLSWKRSLPSLLREVCLATSDIASGKLSSALERYTRALNRLASRIVGLAATPREHIRSGCLAGCAQVLVTNARPQALDVARELDRGSPFFAPHAEAVRATYHLYRGEVHRAAMHRERAERLAFCGGASWSAMSLLTTRWVISCVITGDTVGLIRALADLERLASLSPGLATLYELGQAHLEQLRGHAARALPIYDRVLRTAQARSMPTYAIERAFHARALSAVGDHVGARDLCLSLLREVTITGHDSDVSHVVSHEQYALAEASLGNHRRAVEILDAGFERANLSGNPLWLGLLHRAGAQAAKLAGDTQCFSEHCAAMRAHFTATENPYLIQQCDEMRTQEHSWLDALAPPLGDTSVDHVAETLVEQPACGMDTVEEIGPTASMPAPPGE